MSNREFNLENVEAVYYVTESLLFVSPKLLWEPVLLEIKSCHNLQDFYIKSNVIFYIKKLNLASQKVFSTGSVNLFTS